MENGSFADVVPIEHGDISIFHGYVSLPEGSFTTLTWNFLHLEKKHFPRKDKILLESIMFLEPKWPLFSLEKKFGLKTKDKWVPGS